MVLDNQPGSSAYNPYFLIGIFYLWTSKYEKSRHNFLKAVNETDQMEAVYPIYQSYLGLLEVLNQKHDGLYYCNHAIEISQTLEFETLLNLACAEFISGNRRRSLKALEHTECLKLTPQQIKSLQTFHSIIGQRQIKENGALKRNTFFRRLLSKIFRRSGKIHVQRVEAFIKKTVKMRYKSAVHKLQREAQQLAADHLP